MPVYVGQPPLEFPRPAIIRPAPDELLRYSNDPVAQALSRKRRRAPAGGAAPVTTFAQVGTPTNGNTSTITIPSGAQADDLCIVWNAVRGSSSGGVPSGFDILQEYSGSGPNVHHIISAKKLLGSETTVTGLSGSADTRWIAALFRPDGAYSGFADQQGAANGSHSGGNPSALTINAGSAASLPVIAYGQMIGQLGSISASISPSMTTIAGSSAVHEAHYIIYGASDTPSDHSYDMAQAGTSSSQTAGYMTFTAV